MIKPAMKKKLASAVLYTSLIIATAITLFPFYWTLITSLKIKENIIKLPISYIASPVTFEHYINAWKNMGFSRYFANSMYVSLVSMAFTVFIATMAGYALNRYKFKGKNVFMLAMLCTQFIPAAMLIIPLFKIYSGMGMINNPWSLIITYTTLHIPFNTMLMRGFVANVPPALEEAAMVDGCGRFKAVLHVVMPVLMPGVAATGAFAFISSWNDFIYALMLVNKSIRYTIPIGLNMMIGEFNIDYGTLAAGSCIALVPSILIFSYIQRYMVSGLSSGSVKG